MSILTKAAILAADDLPTQDVPTPEWGDGAAVRLRMLTGTERDAWESSVVGDGITKNMANIRARLVAACAVGEDGKRLFTEAEAGELGKKSSAVIDRLADAARSLSRLNRADVEAAAKNSEAGPSAGSFSASASSSDTPTPID